MMALRYRRAAFLVVVTAALTACAGLPANRPTPNAMAVHVPPAADVSSAAGTGTLLLPVTFINVVQPTAVPGLFEITIAPVEGWDLSFVQPRRSASSTASPGATEFLFRITLPEGRHRITSFSSRVHAQDKTDELALAVSIPFTIKAGEIGYAGRLLLQHTRRSGVSALRVNTQWLEERDIEVYRSLFPEIADQSITLAPFESVRVGATTDDRPDAATSVPFSDLDVMRVATTLTPPTTHSVGLAGLPSGSDELQRAYRDFLQLAFPRAFAISANGKWGVAAGVKDASMRALTRCAKQGQGCRLYAVDDRVVMEWP